MKTTEIERKFLIAEPPEPTGTCIDIEQGYIAVDRETDTQVRIRRVNGRDTLTVKKGTGLSRTEVEIEIAPDVAHALWELTRGRRILKRRHAWPSESGRVVLDVYGGPLAGLSVVEVEFPTETDAGRFTPPPWFGREVTGDPMYANAALAEFKPFPSGGSDR